MDSTFEDEDNGNGVFEDIHNDVSILQYSKQFENEEDLENAMEELLPEQEHLTIKEVIELRLKKFCEERISLIASLDLMKDQLKQVRETKLEIIHFYDECKNRQKEKNYLLQLDLLKLERNCELRKKKLKLREERKLEHIKKISDLQLELKEKEEFREKQAAICNSKTVSIKSDELVLKSYQNEIINIQAEIECLKNLDERLEVNLRLQWENIQKLEEFIRVSKDVILSEHKSKMDKLIQRTEKLKIIEIDIKKDIDEAQNDLNEIEIAISSCDVLNL